MEYYSKSENETLMLGKMLGNDAKQGDIFCLTGDLGSGKTVFSKGLALGLGVGERVTSPTFTFVNEYEGRLPLYHFDVYRLEVYGQAVCFDFEEYFDTGVCVIEWAENILDIIPEHACFIKLERVEGSENERRITVDFSDRHLV